VFLIALCVSIVLEAITRFIEPPEITNPQLILIVGSLGLSSNLLGFAILGGHGHSHGPGSHDHGHGSSHTHEGHAHDEHRHDEISAAEEGLAAGTNELTDQELAAADATGRAADLLPEATVARFQASTPDSAPRHTRPASSREASTARERSDSTGQRRKTRRARGSSGPGRLTSLDEISIHPASFRQDIIAASRPQVSEEEEEEEEEEDAEEVVGSSESMVDQVAIVEEEDTGAGPRETTPLLKKQQHAGSSSSSGSYSTTTDRPTRPRRGSYIHRHHNHNKPKDPSKKHGHTHGDMGMNAMILHVLGDALGNVGVIITALIIWLTDWPGRYYADPAVSLFITLIILRSAIPLTIASSKILLQATPDNIDLNDVREDIQALPGVISCHHVHIWQLSDTKIVASMHIQVAFPISEAGGEKYMELSRMARKCLHAYGIHSATIQPEFCTDAEHAHGHHHAQGRKKLRAIPAVGGDGLHDDEEEHEHHAEHGEEHDHDHDHNRDHDHDQGHGNTEQRAQRRTSSSSSWHQQPPRRLQRCSLADRNQCLLDCVDDCVGQGCCSPSSEEDERPGSRHEHGNGHEQH